MLLVVLDIADLSLELGPVDGRPPVEHEYLVVFGVVIGRGDWLVGHAEEVGVSGLSGDGIEGGELFDPCGFVHLDAERFVDSLTLGLL